MQTQVVCDRRCVAGWTRPDHPRTMTETHIPEGMESSSTPPYSLESRVATCLNLNISFVNICVFRPASLRNQLKCMHPRITRRKQLRTAQAHDKYSLRRTDYWEPHFFTTHCSNIKTFEIVSTRAHITYWHINTHTHTHTHTYTHTKHPNSINSTLVSELHFTGATLKLTWHCS